MNSLICNTAEAKARLNELIAKVEQGATVLIQKRGHKVAKLVPVSHEEPARDDSGQFFKDLRRFHRKIKNRRGQKGHTVAILRELRQER